MISTSSAFLRERTFDHVPINLGYDDLSTIELNEKRHYVIPTGTLKLQTYPSITTVLGHGKQFALENWRKRVGKIEADRVSRVACSRGESLHSLMERYLRNDEVIIDERTMPDALAMFRAIVPCINRHVGRIFLQERPLYSTHLRVAGRTDLIAEWNGRLSVIDFKSSSRIKTRSDIKNYFMQEAAYAIMFEERTGIPIDRLVTLMAVDGQSEALVFVENRDDWTDGLLKAIHIYERDHGTEGH